MADPRRFPHTPFRGQLKENPGPKPNPGKPQQPKTAQSFCNNLAQGRGLPLPFPCLVVSPPYAFGSRCSGLPRGCLGAASGVSRGCLGMPRGCLRVPQGWLGGVSGVPRGGLGESLGRHGDPKRVAAKTKRGEPAKMSKT